jgi:precorrin-6x reductase
MRQFDIQIIVTKDGGPGRFPEKLEAAAEYGAVALSSGVQE